MAIDTSASTLQEYNASPSVHSQHSKGRATEGEISVLDLAALLLERKSIILTTVAVFAVVGTLVSFLLPPQYTATATLLPPQQGSSLGAAIESQLGSLGAVAGLIGGGLNLKNPNDMYVGMLKSRTLENAMISKFGLMSEYHARYSSEARKKLEDHTTLDGSSKDGLIHISVEDPNPDRAAQLANGYVDQFRDLSEHLAITEASQRRLFFQEQLDQAKNQLANSEEALKQTEQVTGMIQPGSQTGALIGSVVALRAQIIAQQAQLDRLQTYATSENAEYMRAQKELANLRAQLARLEGDQSLSAPGLILPKGSVPLPSLEYARKFRDVKYRETIFEILARQLEIAKIDEAKEGASIQVVDKALPPEKRSFPKRTLIVSVSSIAGLFVGILIALLKVCLEQMRQIPETAFKLHQLRQTLFSLGL